MLRTLALVPVTVCLLHGQWGFLRTDPKIETLALHDDGPVDMDQKRILILPFDSNQSGEPAPPEFALPMRDALSAWLVAVDAVVPRERTTGGIRAARVLGFDYLVRGRMELFYQGGAHALKTRIFVEALDLSETPAIIVWQGRKTAIWERRKPPGECLLYLASDFVADWLHEKH